MNALGNAKNATFQQVLRTDGIDPYPGAVRLLDFLDERGTAVAVVSSSRNAEEVLDAAGLAERFSVVVDGNVATANATCPASRHRTRSSPPPPSSVCRLVAPRWSRTPSRASPPAAPATSPS